MKIALNRSYSAFSLSKEARNDLNIGNKYDYYTDYLKRTDEKLISLIEEKGTEYVSGIYARIIVAYVPEPITDYRIDDHDGFETITYVIDGKLYQF